MMNAIAAIEPAVSRSPYREVRGRYVVVDYRREEGALIVLLRFEGAEGAATRDVLRRLGFEANGSSTRTAISWRRSTSPDELRSVCDSLREALRDCALFDLGASFAAGGDALMGRELPTFWRGRFLLHIGGTGRCVLFEALADRGALAREVDAGCADYFANDFRPATE